MSDEDHHLKRLRNEAREREEEQYQYGQRLNRERQAVERAEERNAKYSAVASHLFSHVVLVVMICLLVYFTFQYIKFKANELIAKLPGLPGLPGSVDETTTNVIGVSRSTANTFAGLHLSVIVILALLTFNQSEKAITGLLSIPVNAIGGVFRVITNFLLFVLCVLGPIFSVTGLYDGASPTLLVFLSVMSVCGLLLLGINARHQQLKERAKKLLEAGTFNEQLELLQEHVKIIEKKIEKGKNKKTLGESAMLIETKEAMLRAIGNLEAILEKGSEVDVNEITKLHEEAVDLINRGNGLYTTRERFTSAFVSTWNDFKKGFGREDILKQE